MKHGIYSGLQPQDNLTDKQRAIMDVILKGNGEVDGRFIPVDLDQLLERLSYRTTKDSMHFSLRALIARDFVVKGAYEQRRGRRRTTLVPTLAARQQLTTTVCPSFVGPADDGVQLGLELDGEVL